MDITNTTNSTTTTPSNTTTTINSQEQLQTGASWIFGLVNSSTYFIASLLGSWLSDPLNEHFFGRRGALFFAALFSLAASIGSAYTQSWAALLVCRCLQGIGMGAKAAVGKWTVHIDEK
jgi:MFS family permease